MESFHQLYFSCNNKLGMKEKVVEYGWNLLIMHRFFSSMTTKLQDIEDKGRGVLLHISVSMGNDKFKTLKFSYFSLTNDNYVSERHREHLWIFSSCQ